MIKFDPDINWPRLKNPGEKFLKLTRKIMLNLTQILEGTFNILIAHTLCCLQHIPGIHVMTLAKIGTIIHSPS